MHLARVAVQSAKIIKCKKERFNKNHENAPSAMHLMK